MPSGEKPAFVCRVIPGMFCLSTQSLSVLSPSSMARFILSFIKHSPSPFLLWRGETESC